MDQKFHIFLGLYGFKYVIKSSENVNRLFEYDIFQQPIILRRDRPVH